MLSEFSAEYFARSPALALPVLALGIFLVVFVTATVRALMVPRKQLQRMAELPLAESEEHRHG